MKNTLYSLACAIFILVTNNLIAQTCTPTYGTLPFYEGFELWQSLCNSNKAFPSPNWLNEPTNLLLEIPVGAGMMKVPQPTGLR
jgi:hypothetical protein